MNAAGASTLNSLASGGISFWLAVGVVAAVITLLFLLVCVCYLLQSGMTTKIIGKKFRAREHDIN